jgi:hypothetical protein
MDEAPLPLRHAAQPRPDSRHIQLSLKLIY